MWIHSRCGFCICNSCRKCCHSCCDQYLGGHPVNSKISPLKVEKITPNPKMKPWVLVKILSKFKLNGDLGFYIFHISMPACCKDVFTPCEVENVWIQSFDLGLLYQEPMTKSEDAKWYTWIHHWYATSLLYRKHATSYNHIPSFTTTSHPPSCSTEVPVAHPQPLRPWHQPLQSFQRYRRSPSRWWIPCFGILFGAQVA